MKDFNQLPAHVWPRNTTRDANGVVTLAGVSLTDIVAEYGAPVMVFDEDDFRSRCRDIAGAFGGPERVHYASKAFLSKKIAQWVNEEGLSLDVASLNELRIALASNFPAARITVHGNNKNHEFLTACVQENVGHVVIDSPQEIEQLDAVARENNSVQQVMVRVTPGVDAHTHEFIATSHEDQKFGIGLATGEAFAAVQSCLAADNLELVGLHCHVGSQVFDAEGFKLAAERILTLYSRIHTELGVTLQELDLGGGFGIPYIDTDTALDVSAVAADLLKAVANVADELDITPPTVLVEPGRALVGASAITVYEIGTIKDVTTGKGDIPVRRYYSVEGGLSDNIRPALYGAEYDARVVNRNTSGELAHARLVGSHCESGDILIEEAKFPSDIVTGDLLALAATGAYCYPMSSRYNAAFRPAVVSVAGGKAELMLRRETLEDLLSLEA